MNRYVEVDHYYLFFLLMMKNDSCSLEVKQLLSNMAASRQMFRPIFCRSQILGNHLNREAQGLQSCFCPVAFHCALENHAWGPGYFICVGGEVGEGVGEK